MRVTWLGGPHDGDVIHVPEGCHYVCVPLLAAVNILAADDLDGPPVDASVRVLTVPIKRRTDGRWFAVWHDGTA